MRWEDLGQNTTGCAPRWGRTTLLGRGEWEASWQSCGLGKQGCILTHPLRKLLPFLSFFVKALATSHPPRDHLLNENMLMKNLALFVLHVHPLNMWLLALMSWSQGQALTPVILSRATSQAWWDPGSPRLRVPLSMWVTLAGSEPGEAEFN